MGFLRFKGRKSSLAGPIGLAARPKLIAGILLIEPLPSTCEVTYPTACLASIDTGDSIESGIFLKVFEILSD